MVRYAFALAAAAILSAGCNGEMRNGDNGYDHPGANQSLDRIKDPVCGMMIDKSKARKVTYQGTDYYFCSEADAKKFEADPQKYLPKTQTPPQNGKPSENFDRGERKENP